VKYRHFGENDGQPCKTAPGHLYESVKNLLSSFGVPVRAWVLFESFKG
jgi:hypothetical protein